MFKDQNLLVLSHTYNSFIKNPVEILAKNFNKIYVLVRYSPIAELGNLIPLNIFQSRKKYSRRYSIDLFDKPDNVEVIVVPLWYLPMNFFYKWVGEIHARGVFKILQREKIDFDLIHAHFAWSSGYVGMKVKEEYKKPLVITGHGYDIYEMPFRDKHWGKEITEVLNQADSLLTVSKNNKQIIKNLGVKKDVQILPNGFSPSLFFYKDQTKAREFLKIPRGKKVILTIGNLEKVKGYDVLLKSLQIVLKERNDFLLLHIGGGLEKKRILKLIKNLNLEENVKLLGRKKHQELVDYFAACDFFVSSSLFEGNPTVMFESLACGKAFVGTKVGGVPDIITSDKFGKLAKAGDVRELAENISWALNNSWNSKKILNYATQFSWENIIKKQLKIYENIVHNNS